MLSKLAPPIDQVVVLLTLIRNLRFWIFFACQNISEQIDHTCLKRIQSTYTCSDHHEITLNLHYFMFFLKYSQL